MFIHILQFVRVHYVLACAVLYGFATLLMFADFFVRGRGSSWYRVVAFALNHHHWIRNLRDHSHYLPRNWLFMTGQLCLVFLITIVAPFLFFSTKHREAMRSREYAAQARERDAERNRRIAENHRRVEERARRFTEQPPKWYYETIGGVTAVLPAPIYEGHKIFTEQARLDGRWENADVLRPNGNVTVFVTEKGRELILKNSRGYYRPDGYISELHWFAKQKGIVLERREDILVPWTSEAVRTFDQQVQDFNQSGVCHGLTWMLNTVTPDELKVISVD